MRMALSNDHTPGSGKSVLSAAIVHGLCSQSEYKVLYFFFREGTPSTSELYEMAINLIDQLLYSAEDDDEAKKILERFSRFHDGNLRRRCENFLQLWAHFLDLVSVCDREFLVVLDALDECQEPQEFFDWLENSSEPQRVRFLITTRPYPHIVRELKSFKHRNPDDGAADFRQIEEVSMTGTDQDIETFLQGKISNSERFTMSTPALRTKIISDILGNPKGMFSYAELMLKELRKENCKPVDEVLKSIPKALNTFYARIIARLHDKHFDCQELRQHILH